MKSNGKISILQINIYTCMYTHPLDSQYMKSMYDKTNIIELRISFKIKTDPCKYKLYNNLVLLFNMFSAWQRYK
jgi:hypothetical protein